MRHIFNFLTNTSHGSSPGYYSSYSKQHHAMWCFSAAGTGGLVKIESAQKLRLGKNQHKNDQYDNVRSFYWPTWTPLKAQSTTVNRPDDGSSQIHVHWLIQLEQISQEEKDKQ